ncbi:hypothetical protein ACQKGO_33380 [Corallococcus interemptor]|uniref:hypothetical protein n=1 Tax=Corallococcus interemptor TaxID=2316720 RepID=UPI003D034D37
MDLKNLLGQVEGFKAQCLQLGALIQEHQGTAQAGALEQWLDQLVNNAAGTFTSYAAEVQASELTALEGGYVGKGRADAVSPPSEYGGKTYRGEAIQIKVCRAKETKNPQELLSAAFNQLAGERFEVPLYDENLVAQLWVVNTLNPWPWNQTPSMFDSWDAALMGLDTQVQSSVRAAMKYTQHKQWKGEKPEGMGMPESLLQTLSVLQPSDVFSPGYSSTSNLPRRIQSEYGTGRELVGVRVRLSLGQSVWLKLNQLGKNVRIHESEYIVTRSLFSAKPEQLVVTPLAHLIDFDNHSQWYFNARFILESEAGNYQKKVFWYSTPQPTYVQPQKVIFHTSDATPENYKPAWADEVVKLKKKKTSNAVKGLVTRYLNSMDDVDEKREVHTYYSDVQKWRSAV